MCVEKLDFETLCYRGDALILCLQQNGRLSIVFSVSM